MNTLVAEYWIWLVVALVIGLIVAWYVFHANRKANVTGTSKDVLDEGSDRAARNQALIDSAPAATPLSTPPPAAQAEPVVPVASPTALGGTGAAVAAAAEQAQVRQSRDKPAPAEDTQPAAEDTPPAAPRTQSPAEPVEPAPAPIANGLPLTRIKGIGPKLAARLEELGVTSISQIAAWSESDIDRIDPQLGRFEGRVRRDAWVEQAKLLEQGETGAYEDKFGRLD